MISITITPVFIAIRVSKENFTGGRYITLEEARQRGYIKSVQFLDSKIHERKEKEKNQKKKKRKL